MKKYSVLLITNDEVPLEADGVSIDAGSAVFYKDGIKTEEEKYPDSITIMVFAAGTWTLITLENE
jgi:hypothetical protein